MVNYALNMEEILSFNIKIVVAFKDLGEDLDKKIYEKISEQEFFNFPFEVIDVVDFRIKEMVVSNNVVVCKIKVTARCNNPSSGKIVVLPSSAFTIINGNHVYKTPESRIQIIAKHDDCPNIENSSEIKIKIEAVKQIAKNILCVASIIE